MSGEIKKKVIGLTSLKIHNLLFPKQEATLNSNLAEPAWQDRIRLSLILWSMQDGIKKRNKEIKK